MYHVNATPEWLGPTGFYHTDLQSPPERNERRTWERICVWAAPSYVQSTMHFSLLAESSLPAERKYLLELMSVPDGVVGAPSVGTVWELPLLGYFTLPLPTYRTTEGLTGYQFALTITEAEPGPGDLDNDGDVDRDDFAAFEPCFTGPDGQAGLDCEPDDFARSDADHNGHIDLADFAAFTVNFTGLVVSPPRYIGADGCIECHIEHYSDWAGTIHATAFNTLVIGGEQDNPMCFPCHTVGFGEAAGFVDLGRTPHLANVQCESCHGPGSHHAFDPDNVGLEVELDSSLCGQCHQSCHGLCGDYYHPHFEQWSLSKHSTALADIRWLPDEYEASCLPCHSTDYRLAPEDDKPAASEVLYSLECVACHSPHDATNVSQLRLEPELLCAQCHTMGDAVPGEEPDQSQVELLHGDGGFALDGTPLTGLHTIPYFAIPGECAGCHVYREPYGGPGQPANSGHTFQANMRVCEACHTAEDAAARLTSVREEIEPRLAGIARYLDPIDPLYVDPAALSPAQLAQYDIAKFDYELVNADGSYGAHNAVFARTLLTEAESFFGITP